MDKGEVSRRLKAGRWLAGGRNDKGAVAPLGVQELAKRQPLAANGITANRLEEIEQEKATARPMELEKIADALGLPHGWFQEQGEVSDDQLRHAAELLAPQLLSAARALHLVPAPGLRVQAAPDQSVTALEGGGE